MYMSCAHRCGSAQVKASAACVHAVGITAPPPTGAASDLTWARRSLWGQKAKAVAGLLIVEGTCRTGRQARGKHLGAVC
jgi:hypothetical protein